jgi:hypothetical protein
MSAKRNLSPTAAWENLKRQVAKGKPPGHTPTELQWREITLRPEVFQQRKPSKHLSDAHIRELAKSVEAAPERSLDPITVWWDGKGWTCIDGHHRSAAYKRAGKAHGIAVTVFEGTPDDALGFSARSNTKDKLTMSRAEKTNAAWRLVVFSDMSRSDIARCSGASERTVANMRVTKRRLQDLAATFDPLEDSFIPAYAGDLGALSWEAARRLAAGENAEATFDEDKRVQELATRLRKALGPTAERQSDIFARAVEVYSPMLARALEEYFGEAHDNSFEEV